MTCETENPDDPRAAGVTRDGSGTCVALVTLCHHSDREAKSAPRLLTGLAMEQILDVILTPLVLVAMHVSASSSCSTRAHPTVGPSESQSCRSARKSNYVRLVTRN